MLTQPNRSCSPCPERAGSACRRRSSSPLKPVHTSSGGLSHLHSESAPSPQAAGHMACRASKLVRSRGPQRGSRAAPECWWPRLSPCGRPDPRTEREAAPAPRASLPRASGNQEPTTVTCSLAALGHCSTCEWVGEEDGHTDKEVDARGGVRGWTRQDGARTRATARSPGGFTFQQRGLSRRPASLREPATSWDLLALWALATQEGLYRSVHRETVLLKFKYWVKYNEEKSCFKPRQKKSGSLSNDKFQDIKVSLTPSSQPDARI